MLDNNKARACILVYIIKKGPVQKLFAGCKECQCKELKNVIKLFELKLMPGTDITKDLSHLSHGYGKLHLRTYNRPTK